MRTIGKAKLAALEAAGEDEIFGMIAAGKNASDVIAHYDVGWNLFHKWVASGEGRVSALRRGQADGWSLLRVAGAEDCRRDTSARGEREQREAGGRRAEVEGGEGVA